MLVKKVVQIDAFSHISHIILGLRDCGFLILLLHTLPDSIKHKNYC